eukprot:g70889.t1
MQSAVTDAREFPPGWAEIRKLVKLQGWDLVVFTRDKHPAAELCTKHGDGTKVQHAAHISFRNSSYHDEGDGAPKALSLRRKDSIDCYKFNQTEPFATCTYSLRKGRRIEQTLYPEHCVMGRRGSDLIRELHDLAPEFLPGDQEPLTAETYLRNTAHERVTRYLPRGAPQNPTIFFDKGMDRFIDANSAIFKNDRQTEVTNANPRLGAPPADVSLTRILRASGIRNVVVAGVAADICVKQTCIDLRTQGFFACVVGSATRPFDRHFKLTGTGAHRIFGYVRDLARQQTAAPASSLPDSFSGAARQLYANIAFRLNGNEDVIQLLIERATLAQQEREQKCLHTQESH